MNSYRIDFEDANNNTHTLIGCMKSIRYLYKTYIKNTEKVRLFEVLNSGEIIPIHKEILDGTNSWIGLNQKSPPKDLEVWGFNRQAKKVEIIINPQLRMDIFSHWMPIINPEE